MTMSKILYSGIIWIRIAFAFNCITWDVNQDEMYLIYRTEDFSNSITLKDNYGNVKTICSFEHSSYHCYPIPTFVVINPNIKKEEIIFTIEDFKRMDVDGTWSVSQGSKTFNTIVSISNGLSQSTLVHMTGHTYNSKVTVRCYACRAPYGYNVEILINSRSEDSLTLNYETGKCTHQLGECHPEVCSCSPSGNEFFRSFDLKDVTRTANFSCDMIFVDKTTLTTSRFSKYATIFYDGKDVHSIESMADTENSIMEHNEKNDSKKDKYGMDFKGTLFGIGVPVVIFLMVLTGMMFLYKKPKTENMKQDLKNNQDVENKPLLYTIHDINKDNSNSTDDTAEQVDDHVIEMENTKAIDIVQTSEVTDEKAEQIDNYVIEMEKSQATDIVHASEELHTAVTFDVAFIDFEIEVEQKWVNRVADMLNKKYKTTCGQFGRDFLLEHENSLFCVDKNTTFVVALSEKSELVSKEIRIIENMKKLVVVMVEECIVPIVRKNMKCIDATKDENIWFGQLSTVLNYRTDVKTTYVPMTDLANAEEEQSDSIERTKLPNDKAEHPAINMVQKPSNETSYLKYNTL